MSKHTDPMSKTAEQWHDEARDCMRREQESWERSDTDGFLSQWALQKMAQRYETLAKIVEQGGCWEIAKLADVDGNVIEHARYIETKYGWTWVYDDADGNAVWCRESSHSNREIARQRDLAKGFQIVWLMLPVVMNSSGEIVEKSAA